MSDTSQIQSDPVATPTPTPDPAIPQRDPQGNLLSPGEIPTPTPSPSPSEPTSTPPKDGDKPAPSAGAPEAYADFKLPDGYTLDKAVVDEATPIFKELGLTQDQAQKLVDFHTKQLISAAKAPEDTYSAMRTDWRAKIEADPEIKGASLDGKTGTEAVKIAIGRTLAAIGDVGLIADFKQAMDLTGAGDNPAFIKAMWKLSSLVTEGKSVKGTGPSPHGQVDPAKAKPQTGAHALYPNLS